MGKNFGHWNVIENGIEWNQEKRGHYFIEKSRLLELGPAEHQTYEWLLHIPPKTWLNEQDILDLNNAFVYAAKIFGYELDEKILENTLSEQKTIIENKSKDEDNDDEISI